GGAFGGGWITDTRLLEAGNSLGTDMPDAPIRTGYAFKEWNTAADGSGTEFTGSTVVNSDITVYAQWIPTYEVIVIDSYAAVNGTGNYTEGTLVTIDAGIRSGYTFAGWTVDMGTAVLADASDAITTFLMPNEDVTVTAQWTQNTYEVTVIGSYAAVNGTGTYTEGTLVTIDAGSRSGYTFNGWIVNAGAATLANANNAITTFTMPAENVTVTAQWRNNGGTGGGGNGGGTIVNPGKPVVPPEKPDPPDPPEPPARIIIVLLYMWAVAAFVYNKYREFEIEKENKK
ncbi:MAG: InlB B-repeat-containing protein, partial [Methanimicrococcus sp.]|nr:InlB B-repeat-containing protein [Methanimicrococcus sp.]